MGFFWRRGRGATALETQVGVDDSTISFCAVGAMVRRTQRRRDEGRVSPEALMRATALERKMKRKEKRSTVAVPPGGTREAKKLSLTFRFSSKQSDCKKVLCKQTRKNQKGRRQIACCSYVTTLRSERRERVNFQSLQLIVRRTQCANRIPLKVGNVNCDSAPEALGK